MPFKPTERVQVVLWGERVGALAPSPSQPNVMVFAYDPKWLRNGIEISPLLMPGRSSPYRFRYQDDTFMGLPPAIADALPDRFGNAVIDADLARLGVPASQVTALDRLAYLGNRAMGALEFVPDTGPSDPRPTAVDLSTLVIAAREAIEGSLSSETASEDALRQIIAVGTSAGGARAKAVVAIDPDTGDVRPGNITVPDHYEHWILKFDGMGADSQLGASQQYTRIEYAYSLMARDAGIEVPRTRLLEENNRAHFLVERFDRQLGEKQLTQTLCAMAGLDYNLIDTHDYAQLFNVARDLDVDQMQLLELFRRMAFNVAASNCDDHTKNHSFLLRKEGMWQIAPAYDLTFAYRPGSTWVARHLMAVNGRREGITTTDLMAVADRFKIGPDPRSRESLANLR
ncbi:type II toxin-antitoxin system HipA family toxin [Aeromicrobium sp. PE09-221]|uniref:type II toxin-antitoxin system HipA family toxin n=1 Tax=Aeromicrobium sp. PE09-221 TaxID=1898043 RepID=UPI00191C7FE6|nr:type II toxin-antitoxin system HipA family toxin [Aeromicrobium sp. PE09-221]